jgi:hypothetical protein
MKIVTRQQWFEVRDLTTASPDPRALSVRSTAAMWHIQGPHVMLDRLWLWPGQLGGEGIYSPAHQTLLAAAVTVTLTTSQVITSFLSLRNPAEVDILAAPTGANTWPRPRRRRHARGTSRSPVTPSTASNQYQLHAR